MRHGRIRKELTPHLIAEGVVAGNHLGIDSCPVESRVKENNLKTALRHSRYDKHCHPKTDPDARQGVRIHSPSEDRKKLDYFWGYLLSIPLNNSACFALVVLDHLET